MRCWKLPSLLTLVLLATVEPGTAQTIEQRFERWFGPPVGPSGEGTRPSRPAERARPRAAAPAAASVPTPSERPAEAAPSPSTAASDEPAEPAAEPDTPEETVPTEAGMADDGTPESDAQDKPADAASGPETIPTPESRPATEAPSEPEAPADEPADAEEAPEPEPEPEPAYVPPEDARTVPEENAPETPGFEVTPQESVEAARAIEEARECEAELKARGAEFTVAPSLSEGQCGVLRPVALTRTSSGVAVELETQMLCRTALAFDIWVGEGVVPAARAELGSDAPSAIRHASTYVCRDRASETGISEHGRGSAIDIGAFEWDGRDAIAVEAQAPGSAEDRFLASVRRAACGPFQTVIGPGTDADHSDHFHLDIAARSNGSTYCR